MVLDLLAAVRRHHEPGLAIKVGAPVELIEAPFHPALALSDRLQDFKAGRNDLLPDAVAGNDCDPIAPHGWDPEGEETGLASRRSAVSWRTDLVASSYDGGTEAPLHLRPRQRHLACRSWARGLLLSGRRAR